MDDIYTRMQATARRLLAPTSSGGMGQGVIVLGHKTEGVVDPSKPWVPVAPTMENETIGGAVRGVSQQLVGVEMGGTVILASDRQAICEVPSIEYKAGDVLSVDGKPVHIISYSKIPAAGTTVAVRFIIRG